MAWLPFWFTKENFSLSADILSLVSFVMTVLVYFNVRKLKNFYILKARIPDLIKNLKAHTSKMIELRKNFLSFRDEILLEVERSEITLKSIKKKVDKEIKLTVVEAEGAISLYKSDARTENLANIYNKIHKLILDLELQQKDRKWEQNV